jgi:hypothetical protein
MLGTILSLVKSRLLNLKVSFKSKEEDFRAPFKRKLVKSKTTSKAI